MFQDTGNNMLPPPMRPLVLWIPTACRGAQYSTFNFPSTGGIDTIEPSEILRLIWSAAILDTYHIKKRDFWHLYVPWIHSNRKIHPTPSLVCIFSSIKKGGNERKNQRGERQNPVLRYKYERREDFENFDSTFQRQKIGSESRDQKYTTSRSEGGEKSWKQFSQPKSQRGGSLTK